METEHKTMNTPTAANRQKLIAGQTIQQWRAKVGNVSNWDQVLNTLHSDGLSVRDAVLVGKDVCPNLYAEDLKARMAGHGR
jgi:hypothetical protein